jgi:hypothetical protein
MTQKFYETLNSIYSEGLDQAKYELLRQELSSSLKDQAKIQTILAEVYRSATKKHRKPNESCENPAFKAFLSDLNLKQGDFFVPISLISELYKKYNPNSSVSLKTLGKWLSGLGFKKKILKKNSEMESHYLMSRPLDVDFLIREQ